jgi:NAD/NADP transhydrogenase alpha subunit
MKLLIPREWAPGEKRVAVTPETVRRLQGRHIDIEVEQGAGVAAGFPDSLYNAIGASVVDRETWTGAVPTAFSASNPLALMLWGGCVKALSLWVSWRPTGPRT